MHVCFGCWQRKFYDAYRSNVMAYQRTLGLDLMAVSSFVLLKSLKERARASALLCFSE